MSEPRIAAVVCEGPTDVPIFREIIQELWPSVEDVRSLQPELDAIGKVRRGKAAGWAQVRAWCERHSESLDDVLDPVLGDRIDLLVIAIDVDVAIAAGLDNAPRSVGAYETSRLQRKMRSWLLPGKKVRVDKRIVLSTPVRAIEAWVLAALFRKQKAPESVLNPAEELVSRKRLRKGRDGKPHKELAAYREFGRIVAQRLVTVRRCCPEAERTCQAIESRRDATDC